MTDEQSHFLKTSINEIVVLDLADGRSMLAQILVVFDEGDTPDLFCMEVEPTPSGYRLKGETGHSILLADVVIIEAAPVIQGEPD